MYQLMQHLIAFKYACKLNHWRTDNFADHLLFDRLAEDIDKYTDSIAESHFMASDNKKVFKSDILDPKLIKSDLSAMCESIIQHLDQMQSSSDDNLNEGDKSLLGTIEEGFLGKLAIAKLAK